MGLALLALVGAGVGYSAESPSAKLHKQDRVYGGGQFGPGCFSNSTFCFELPRNLAVDGHAEGDGAEAVGSATYASPAGPGNTHRSITCLRVEGNTAAIGGIIESGPSAGWWYVQYFVDRGGPGLGDRDLASPSFTERADAPGWPEGFPYSCPSPTTGFAGGEPIYLELHAGDIVVQDAPSD
jgi:hypothetical protein